ncbi:MAG: DUF4179 domain-containing protein [Chloroflexota bacterium]|nr:DUF4179 domain-containing protein [Chloroflexota bacterium]
MSAGDREQAELLDAYRVMLARDPAAAPPGGLEPEVAAVAKVLARHYAPAPDAAFAAALRRRLLAGASQGQGKEATMTHRQDPTSRIGANDRPPSDVRDLPTPRADRRPSSVILTGANALASAAVIAVLVLALVLVLRGPGRGVGPAAAPTQQTESSACPPSLLPVTPATPPNTPIPATPTGREASLFVACAFERDPGLRRAEEVGLVQHPNASQTVNGFTLTVQRFYADANRIVVGYTIAAADWITGDHRLDHRPFAGGLKLTDSAGRTYQEDGRYRVSYGGFGPERLAAYIVGFDASGLPPAGGEETFRLSFAESPIDNYRPLREQPPPVPTVIPNAEGTPAGRVIAPAAPPVRPERAGTAGPWEITLIAPVSPGRIAEVNQTVTSNVVASYSFGAEVETPVSRCAACPGAPLQGIAIAVERVVVTLSETRVYLRFTGPELDQRAGGWEVRGIGIEDSVSKPEQDIPMGQFARPPRPDSVYVVSFSNPLYDKPRGEWTLNIGELLTTVPPEPARSERGSVIVRLKGQWTYRFTMP